MVVHPVLAPSAPAGRTHLPATGWLGGCDWRGHQRWQSTVGGRATSSTRSTSDRGEPAMVFNPRAVGRVAELEGGSSPRSRAITASVAFDLPGFGHYPRGTRAKSRCPATRASWRARARPARGSTRAGRRRQLDGRPDRGRAGRGGALSRWSGSYSSRRRGSRPTANTRLATRSMPAMKRAQQSCWRWVRADGVALRLARRPSTSAQSSSCGGGWPTRPACRGPLAGRAAPRRRDRRLHVRAGGDPRLRPEAAARR